MNASSYRLPRADVLASWGAQVPPAFRFALKAPRRLTQGELPGDARGLAAFQRAAAVLGRALGVVLYQLSPERTPDLPALRAFLARLPHGVPAAVEAKNRAWLGEPFHTALADAGVALCVTDDAEGETPLVATARFGYLRLRRDDYDDAALARWVERVRAQPWTAAYVFFRHEDTARGPRLAERMMAL